MEMETAYSNRIADSDSLIDIIYNVAECEE